MGYLTLILIVFLITRSSVEQRAKALIEKMIQRAYLEGARDQSRLDGKDWSDSKISQ